MTGYDTTATDYFGDSVAISGTTSSWAHRYT